MAAVSFTLDDLNPNKNLIDFYEFIIAPIYIIFILFFSIMIRERYYKKSPLKKYFIPAIIVKIIGGITVCLIYNYYYVGGDTSAYFNEGRLLSKILIADPVAGIRLLFAPDGEIPDDLRIYVQGFIFAQAKTAFLIVKITSVIELFTFHSFLVTSIVFGFLSFWGIWRIFTLFVRFYPALEKQFAFSFLFLPSVFFWGSGILKDTICLACLCILFCSVYGFLIEGKNKTSNLIYIIITTYFIMVLKVYIIMSFTVCIFVLIFLNYRGRIRSTMVKNFITPIFIFVSVLAGFFAMKVFAENAAEGIYRFDRVLETAQMTREYIGSVTSGSKYSLGEFENSIWGLLKVFPAAVNVTLFRPYLWEAHNFVAAFASLENLFILILTIKVVYKTGLSKMIKIIISNDLIFFLIIFSIFFAFAVGLTAANFGTLVRYKIPCMPFYLAGIYLIQHIAKRKKEEIQLRKILWRRAEMAR